MLQAVPRWLPEGCMAPAVSQPTAYTLPATLREGARVLGVALQPPQVEQLLAFMKLLQRWNAVHNLSGVRDPKQLLSQHVMDSLAAAPSLTAHAGGKSLRLLDAGTGAGLPAVILAIALPAWRVDAVDAVGKKIAFVRQVAGELGLSNLFPVHARLEELGAGRGPYNVVISRAFSSLAEFVQRTHQSLADDGVWVAMKGKVPEAEMQSLLGKCELFHVEPLAVPGLAAQRCLVWMRPSASPKG